MDSIDSRMEQLAKNKKRIQLKSTCLISQLSHKDKQIKNHIDSQKSTYTDIESVLDIEDIPQQAQPFNAYQFHKLSLISSLTTYSQLDLLESIQQKKQKYNQRFKSKQINRNNFLNKITQSLSQINMTTSVQIQNINSNEYQNENNDVEKTNQKQQDNNGENTNQEQLDQDDQNVSLTLSGQKQTTHRKTIKQKDLHTHLKMSINQGNHQDQQLSQPNSTQISKPNSTYQSTQKPEKQRKKVLIKRSNKQSLQTSQRNNRQQQSMKKNTKSKTNNKKDSQQQNDNNRSENMLKSRNQFMFLEQYQKDQKQIMNRLLNIIQYQIHNKKSQTQMNNKKSQTQMNNKNIQNHNKKMINQSQNKSIFIDSHNNQSKQINRNQTLKSSIHRNQSLSIYKNQSSIKKNHYNKQNHQEQVSIIMDKNLLRKQRMIKELQENRRKKNYKSVYSIKQSVYSIKQHDNKNILSQTVKFNIKGNQHINNNQQSFSLNQSKQSHNTHKQSKQFNNDEHRQIKVNKKQQTKHLTFRQDNMSQQNYNQQQINFQQQSDQETINFQQLYQRFKQQQTNNKNNKNTKNPSLQQISSPQFSSINPSHQTSVNQILFSQTSLKNNLYQSQQNKTNSQLQSIKKQSHQLQKDFQNTSFNINITPMQYKPNTSITLSQNKHKQQQTKTKSLQNKQTIQQKKQSVLIEIPFDNQNTFNSNISLADAFKKKFGSNKLSNKNKQKQSNSKTLNQPIPPLSQLKHKQNNNNFTQIPNLSIQQISINNDFEKTLTKQSKSKPIKIHQRNKQNINSLQTPRTHSQKGRQTDRSLKTNSIKQPPKQLIDRLIYGKKVNMTKKDMYQLSKKNYMKLPEIEQRRKQQEKRQKQIQRLQKIKQYQKRIRSKKHSHSKDSIKTSIDIDINQ